MVVMRTGSWSMAPPGSGGVAQDWRGSGQHDDGRWWVRSGGPNDTGAVPRLAPRPPARHHRPVIHLRSVTFRAASERAPRGFPFDLPALRDVTTIDFRAPVTMLVGENGSGKSTLLEALAIAAKAITAGSADATADPTLDGVRALADTLRLTWTKRPGRGFFLRAEDFFGYARRLDAMRAGLEDELAPRRGRVRRRRALRPRPGRLPDPGRAGGAARALRRRPRPPLARRELPALLRRATRPRRHLLPRRARGAAVAGPPAVVPGAAQGDGGRRARRSSWRPTPRSCWPIRARDLLSFERRRSRRVRYDELEHVTPDPRLPARPRGVPAPSVTGSIPRVTEAPVIRRLPAGIVGCLTLLMIGWTGLLIPSLIRSIKVAFEVDDAGIGLVYLGYAVAYAIGSFGGGPLTERFGRQHVLGGGGLAARRRASPAWAWPRAGPCSSSPPSPPGSGQAAWTAARTASCSTSTARAAAGR